ncbi:MAG: zinc-ribbon domain-containing protein [Bacilli bacterium]|nr:zinc-ribbon domain-containing protein [Bacilli bacterium]
MKCSKCGTDNDINNSYCTKCGQKLINDNNNSRELIVVEEKKNSFSIEGKKIENKNDIEEAKKLGNISLGLFFLVPIISSLLSAIFPPLALLSGLCPMAGIVILIIGRVKYPEDKFLKGIMWGIIVCIILAIISMILFTIWCYVTCSSIDLSGCD